MTGFKALLRRAYGGTYGLRDGIDVHRRFSTDVHLHEMGKMMLTIEITTPDCEEGEAYVYECERHELMTALAGVMVVYPNFTHVAVFPYETLTSEVSN